MRQWVVGFEWLADHAGVRGWTGSELLTKLINGRDTYWVTDVVSADFMALRSAGLGFAFGNARATVRPPRIRTPEQEVTLAFLNSE